MQVTEKDIIKILTIDEELKNKLLSEWDTYTEDQRLNLEDIIWDTYADLYQIRYGMNTQIALQELSTGEDSMDTKFAQRIKARTDDEIEQLFEKGLPAADLEDTREKLQGLMQNVVTNNHIPANEDTTNEGNKDAL